MLKNIIIASVMAFSSLTLIACDKDSRHQHLALTNEQKKEQVKENIQEMNVLASELEAEGFRVYPVVNSEVIDLNFATDLVGKLIIEAAGSEKLTRIQGKLEKFIGLAKETIDFSDDAKLEENEVQKIKAGLANAQTFNEAIDKEVAQERQEAREEGRPATH